MNRDEAIREALVDACQQIYDDSEQKFLASLSECGFMVVSSKEINELLKAAASAAIKHKINSGELIAASQEKGRPHE